MSDRSGNDDRGSEEMFGGIPVRPSSLTVRSVDWRSIMPWTIIFRTVPLAGGVSVVVLGSIGVLLSWFGWFVGGLVFGVNDDRIQELPHLASIQAQHESAVAPAVQLPRDRKLSELPTDGVAKVVRYYWEPAVGVLRVPAEKGLISFAYMSWGLLWSMAVWSWIGGAIARIAVLRLGRDEAIGLKEAILYSSKRFIAFFAPPLYPLAMLLVLAVLGIIPGLLVRLDFGAAIVSVVWFVGLLVSMVFAVVVLGVLIGWPIMVVTTAAEGTDSLDGLARGFAYTFQRPINYALYLIISLLFSVLCVAVAALIANLVLDLTYWSVSWGAGGERIAELRPSIVLDLGPVADEAEGEPSGALSFARTMFTFWDGLLSVLLNGFTFGLFWCLYAAIYLLLRRDVDETEVDEIFIDEPENPLPELSPSTTRNEGSRPAESKSSVESKTAEAGPADDSAESSPSPDSPAGEGSSGSGPVNEPGSDPIEPDEPVKDD